jgi:5'-3' exonuclease
VCQSGGVPGPLLVVDAPSLLYRAFFALPKSITGTNGESVNALLGCANAVLWVVERHAPRAVILCDGAEAGVYRKLLYPPYHGDRPPTPEQLAPQFADAPAFYRSFGWDWEDAGDLEADDLLGAYALAEAAAGGTTLVFSGDRDMFQTASEQTSVLYPRGGKDGPELVDVAGVRSRYGIEPAQVPDFIALRGDPSDGLPGAKGIGEKSAATLLQVHGDLEGAIAAAATRSQMTPRQAASLLDQADELRAFRKIATLQPMTVACPPDRPTDRAGAAVAAAERGMRRLAERLLAD